MLSISVAFLQILALPSATKVGESLFFIVTRVSTEPVWFLNVYLVA